MNEILDGCSELIDVIEVIKPIFNYKDNSAPAEYTRKNKKVIV